MSAPVIEKRTLLSGALTLLLAAFILYGLYVQDLPGLLQTTFRDGPLIGLRRLFLLFFGPYLLIFLLEWLFPAEPRQHRLYSILQDLTWYLFTLASLATIYVSYNHWLNATFRPWIEPWSLHLDQRFPLWLQILIAFLVVDFVGYAKHWVYHQVPWLWAFHGVHHSQKHLNVFTQNRFHLGEMMLTSLCLGLPLLFLGVSYPGYFFLGWTFVWLDRLQHSNIRTNLGPLRYLIVSPQFHRVHHSNDPRHYNKNFSVYLSIWDYLFRTHHSGSDEYPATGIDDPAFPVENSSTPLALSFWLQNLYPFQKIIRLLRPTPTEAQDSAHP